MGDVPVSEIVVANVSASVFELQLLAGKLGKLLDLPATMSLVSMVQG